MRALAAILFVAVAVVVVVVTGAGCGPTDFESNLAGFPLQSQLFLDGPAPFVEFSLFGQGTPGDPNTGCPLATAPKVTFDGKPAAQTVTEHGGLQRGDVTSGAFCRVIALQEPLVAADPARDGELVIENDGGHVRYVGKNLIAARKFQTSDDLQHLTPTSVVHFTYAPASDALSSTFASYVGGGTERQLGVSVDASGVIAVTLDGDTTSPAKIHLSTALAVPTAACEGFRSCPAATGGHEEDFDIAFP